MISIWRVFVRAFPPGWEDASFCREWSSVEAGKGRISSKCYPIIVRCIARTLDQFLNSPAGDDPIGEEEILKGGGGGEIAAFWAYLCWTLFSLLGSTLILSVEGRVQGLDYAAFNIIRMWVVTTACYFSTSLTKPSASLGWFKESRSVTNRSTSPDT